MGLINVRLDEDHFTLKKGIRAKDVLRQVAYEDSDDIVAVKVNKHIRELDYCLLEDCVLEPINLRQKDGQRIYIRSLVFVLIRACRDLFPGIRVSVEHSFAGGLYCELHGDITLTPRLVDRIEDRMREIIKADEPFEKVDTPIKEANEIFKLMGFDDKIDILKYRPEDTISLYICGPMRSEEHTSELQSRPHLVCRLLLEKKKKN